MVFCAAQKLQTTSEKNFKGTCSLSNQIFVHLISCKTECLRNLIFLFVSPFPSFSQFSSRDPENSATVTSLINPSFSSIQFIIIIRSFPQFPSHSKQLVSPPFRSSSMCSRSQRARPNRVTNWGLGAVFARPRFEAVAGENEQNRSWNK